MRRLHLLSLSLSLCLSLLLPFSLSLSTPIDESGDNDIGYFWQLTDMHWDPFYAIGSNIKENCHNYSDANLQSLMKTWNSPNFNARNALEPLREMLRVQYLNSGNGTARMFGEYECDSPLTLVDTFLSFMVKTHASPDFILWSGDDPSFPGDLKGDFLNQSFVDNVIEVLAEHIQQHFPSTTVFPSAGNHEVWFPSQLSSTATRATRSLMELWMRVWGRWIVSDTARESIRKGGYYTDLIRPGFRIISLNTLWCDYANLFSLFSNVNEGDMEEQWEWLDAVLANATAHNERVIILGHVPPGVKDDRRDVELPLFFSLPQCTTRYMALAEQYSDIIAAHVYGHEHSDSWRVLKAEGGGEKKRVVRSNSAGRDGRDHHNRLRDRTGRLVTDNSTAYGLLYIAPALTPQGPTHNPSVRLYSYNRTTLSVTGYVQYFLDLEASNAQGTPAWVKEYLFPGDYGLSDVQPETLDNWLSSLQRLDIRRGDLDIRSGEREIRSGDEEIRRIVERQASGYTYAGEYSTEHVAMTLCAMNNVRAESFEKCYAEMVERKRER